MQPTLVLSKFICLSTGVILYANYEQLEADLIQLNVFIILSPFLEYEPEFVDDGQNTGTITTIYMCSGT